MEIFDLAEKKKALAPPEIRYTNPHREAMKVSYTRRFSMITRRKNNKIKTATKLQSRK